MPNETIVYTIYHEAFLYDFGLKLIVVQLNLQTFCFIFSLLKDVQIAYISNFQQYH